MYSLLYVHIDILPIAGNLKSFVPKELMILINFEVIARLYRLKIMKF